MKAVQQLMCRLACEDDGASAAEYAVLVAVIVAAVAAAVAVFNLGGIFTQVHNKVIACVTNGSC